MKRSLDIVGALLGLACGSVVLIPAMIAVWLQDGQSPFYVAPRAGRNGKPFLMMKLRTMRVQTESSGSNSTAADDPRITAVGRTVRRWKLDELPQLWNVLKGEMSLVGPRPQVLAEVARYTLDERELLSVRPGITDISSIVFADEGDILRGSPDVSARYDGVIRPWKSRLGLLYVRSGPHLSIDLRLLFLTILSFASRRTALAAVQRLVRKLGGDHELQAVTRRVAPLRDGGRRGT